jgi:hypothetical protein
MYPRLDLTAKLIRVGILVDPGGWNANCTGYDSGQPTSFTGSEQRRKMRRFRA